MLSCIELSHIWHASLASSLSAHASWTPGSSSLSPSISVSRVIRNLIQRANIFKVADIGIDYRTPRKQAIRYCTLKLDRICPKFSRASWVCCSMFKPHPLLIHDNGDKVMSATSGCLLDVVRLHVLVTTPDCLMDDHGSESIQSEKYPAMRLCGETGMTSAKIWRSCKHSLLLIIAQSGKGGPRILPGLQLE